MADILVEDGGEAHHLEHGAGPFVTLRPRHTLHAQAEANIAANDARLEGAAARYDQTVLTALEDAASGWWTDALIVVMTINRGRLTLRMMGDDLDAAQLTAVSELFEVASRSLRAVAIAQPAQS